jgi:hypothetical protein
MVQQGLLSSQQVVWLLDGGRGFWRLLAEPFAPYATAVLDFYHLAQKEKKVCQLCLLQVMKSSGTMGLVNSPFYLRHRLPISVHER